MSKMQLRPALLALTLGAAAALAATPTLAASLDRIAFVPTSLSPGQGVRITLTNLAPSPGIGLIPPGPCRAQINFYDAQGDAVGEPQTVDVAPGTSRVAYAPLAAGDGSVDVAPVTHLRATVLLPPGPCRGLDAGYEVFDVRTGGSLFMNPGVIRGFNPQPDPPGLPILLAFAPTTVDGGRNVRVTLVNLLPPDPIRSRVPPDPCHAQVNFYDPQGNAVGEPQGFDLLPGQSTVAIAPAATPVNPIDTVPAVQLRATVQVPPGPCRALNAGYEIYNTTDGSTQFMNPGVIRGFNPQPDPPG